MEAAAPAPTLLWPSQPVSTLLRHHHRDIRSLASARPKVFGQALRLQQDQRRHRRPNLGAPLRDRPRQCALKAFIERPAQRHCQTDGQTKRQTETDWDTERTHRMRERQSDSTSSSEKGSYVFDWSFSQVRASLKIVASYSNERA